MTFLRRAGWRGIATIAVVLLFASMVSAQPVSGAEIVADLLPRLERPVVLREASASNIRRPVPSDGVLKDALFLHPAREGHAARAEISVSLPKARPGERLLLAFDIALSDGIPPEGRPKLDGVRFIVEAEGKRLYARDWQESRWCPGAADLTPWAGRTICLAFLSDPRQSVAYDWALWGNPRILRVTKGNAPASHGVVSLALRSGVPVSVRVEPVGGAGEPIVWQASGEAGEPQWAALDFAYPDAKGVRVTVTPPDALLPDSLSVAPYPERPVLSLVSATRSVPLAGQPTTLRVEVRNTGHGMAGAGRATVALRVNGKTLPPRKLPPIAPGERWRGEWVWNAPAPPGNHTLSARLTDGKGKTTQKVAAFATFAPPRPANTIALDGRNIRLEFVRSGAGYAYGRLLSRQNPKGTLVPVATLSPLLRVQLPDRTWEIRPQTVAYGKDWLILTGKATDPDGVPWQARLEARRETLTDGQEVIRLRYAWTPGKTRRISALWGPNLYAGEEFGGSRKTGALFPGLEYLSGGEYSSSPRGFAPPLNDRRTPHPHKVTIPVMAVTLSAKGEASPLNPSRFWCPDSLKDGSAGTRPEPADALTVAQAWNPLQKWDGKRAFPSPRFVTPNDEEGMDNHRIGLFLPSVPDLADENANAARQPFSVVAGQTLTLDATLSVTRGPAMTALRTWITDRGGIPEPAPLPRSDEATRALNRLAYDKTLWDREKGQWKAVVEGPPVPNPGIAALLWWDARLAARETDRARSAARFEEAIASLLRGPGPGSLTDRSACHILRWELPFLYGYLPEAMAGLEMEIAGILAAQQADGGWRFGAKEGPQGRLGRAGDSVSGVSSHHAWMLLRHARVTGDERTFLAGEKALRFLERFRVPRGASVWECPIYEPDILASAWNLAACLEGYRATGNRRWLHDAVYWAETSVPFIYLWNLPGFPVMRGASIATFGTTHYTHSWLATPVQWEGLTLAFHLRHLADALEKDTPKAGGSPLLLSLRFRSADWRRLAENLTVSGIYQQVATGDKAGTYPDSISDFARPNPVFINPENIWINLLARDGKDPDIQTLRGDGITVSSGARLSNLTRQNGSVRFTLRSYPNDPSSVLVAGVRPDTVSVNGEALHPSNVAIRREAGWWWDAQQKRLYLVIPPSEGDSSIEIRQIPEPGPADLSAFSPVYRR